jgi:hypothetical protein
MSRHPDIVLLQSVFAAHADQSWLGTIQYKPKLAQLSYEVRLVQEAPSMLRVMRHTWERRCLIWFTSELSESKVKVLYKVKYRGHSTVI